jgi:hypothetical protein
VISPGSDILDTVVLGFSEFLRISQPPDDRLLFKRRIQIFDNPNWAVGFGRAISPAAEPDREDRIQKPSPYYFALKIQDLL